MYHKIAFLTTIFPMKKEYLVDCFNSLNNQTFKDFTLIVVNDGYKNFEDIKTLYPELNIIELQFSDTPVKNREHGINYALKNDYDIIVFGDSDDYFESNRIEVCIGKLNIYDIVVNDLTLFSQHGAYSKKYISNRIRNNTEIDLEYVKDKNIFGMSNTAVKTKIIENIDFNSELIALDWYIFSILLLRGNKAIFTSDTETYYRQYENNTIGIGKISKESILKGISVKEKHYELLKSIDAQYESLYTNINELKSKIKDTVYLEKLLKQDLKYPLWWEEIKLIEEII